MLFRSARAAAASKQSRIAAEVAERLPGAAVNDDDVLQFPMDEEEINPNPNSGGKKTKKRTVRRKRMYKGKRSSHKSKRSSHKSKRSSHKSKRSSHKSKRSVKRGGASDPITFNIVKGNGLNPLFEVELNPNETGKDLYDRVNQWLEQNPAYLTDDERAGERKLVTDNATPVKYDDILSSFISPTTIILSIESRQNAAKDDALEARLIAHQND